MEALPTRDVKPVRERRAAGPDLKRELLWGSFWMIVFSVTVYVGLVAVFRDDIPEGLKTLLAMVVGNLLNNFKDAFSYYFGASAGTQGRLADPPAPTVPAPKPPVPDIPAQLPSANPRKEPP